VSSWDDSDANIKRLDSEERRSTFRVNLAAIPDVWGQAQCSMPIVSPTGVSQDEHSVVRRTVGSIQQFARFYGYVTDPRCEADLKEA
jgi:hypothetical protein